MLNLRKEVCHGNANIFNTQTEDRVYALTQNCHEGASLVRIKMNFETDINLL